MKASASTASAGLGKIILDDQLRGADANPAGENAYPIVSLTWILAYPEYEKNGDVKDSGGKDEPDGLALLHSDLLLLPLAVRCDLQGKDYHLCGMLL